MSAHSSHHLAVDLGASSGRVALAKLEGDRLELSTLHRFPNGGVDLAGRLYWDILFLWQEVRKGLSLAPEPAQVESLGIDSWAIDFALLDDRGHLLDGVRHYRDPRTEGVMERAFERMPRERIYQLTGIQFLPFNSLYQLLALQQEAPDLLGLARKLLLVPDLLHVWLTGVEACEETNASTTQLYDSLEGDWSREVLRAFGLPDVLAEIIPAGSILGSLRPELIAETGLTNAKLVAVGSHDTASAVAAVPARGENWAYISSGTWSLVGLETPEPVITPAALAADLTNERGVYGTNRLLKNVMGLWILQQCQATWRQADTDALLKASEDASPFQSLIHPDDRRFLPSGTDMPERIRAFCRETGQAVPETPAEMVRCILESLAIRYAEVLDTLERVAGRSIQVVHVVGGGAQNRLLAQWAANASARPVVTGPVEATLMGNALVQAVALGRLEPQHIREVVRRSSVLETFEPESDWRAARERFTALGVR